ncbi:hypothetical protein GCM10011521_12190 [Arenimonas soli]|uniref:Excisionase n=1 Tax=Arenimonas soli TaxID=2269504 RepID=A0ABQ1HGZ8_9GAMM|nr:DNA-binding protein [Arenimonas soli]GGA75583.1 hypothetical protein GCM10011521_12190 [Arenimonas soli]
MLPTLSRVSQIAQDTGTTEAQWRWWIHRAQENGLASSGALIRIGRSVFLDREKAAAWLQQLAGCQARAA